MTGKNSRKKRGQELEALYDAVNEETLMICRRSGKVFSISESPGKIRQIHGDECDPFTAPVPGCTETQNI